MAIILVIVAAVLAVIIGVTINLYSEALASRYPYAMELLKRKPVAAGIALVFAIIVAAILPMANSASSPQSGSRAETPKASSPPSQSGRAPVEVPQSPSPAPNAPSSSTTKPGQPPTATRAPGVRYKGVVTIIRDTKDLDRIPPVKAEEEDGGDFEYNFLNGKIYSAGDATFALWEGKKQPSYFDCTDRAAAASMTSLDLQVGDTVCALTSEGRTVRMKANRHCDGYCGIFDTVVWETTVD